MENSFMGLFDFLKGKKKHESNSGILEDSDVSKIVKAQGTFVNTPEDVDISAFINDPKVKDSPDSFVDGSDIPQEERQFYQPDNYYTYYSYAGTYMSSRVITFEERKLRSYPSARGLYVAEILLLEYCTYGNYPNPSSGYPGLWWFAYGIRDVGKALRSLEERGFVQWAPKAKCLEHLKVADLKQILQNAGLPTTGKKTELIDRITSEISDDKLDLPNYAPKYELTELGRQELEDNGYVPYMHKHKDKTTEDERFGSTFNVWSINKLFPDGNAKNWRQVVGKVEKQRFGVDLANELPKVEQRAKNEKIDYTKQRDKMRQFLKSRTGAIKSGIKVSGDGYDEEAKGLKLKQIGKDGEALVQFYISIGKRFDAPALYKNAAILLRKYGMYEEELQVIEQGLQTVKFNDGHWEEMEKRKVVVEDLIKKNK